MVAAASTMAMATKILLPNCNPNTAVPTYPRRPLLPFLRRPPHPVHLRCFRTRSTPASPSAGPSPVAGDLLSAFSATGGDLARRRLARLVDEFRALPEPLDRVKRLLAYASTLPPLPESDRAPSNRVMGCTAQVWLLASLDARAGRVHFVADSDSEITRGFCACLLWVLDGAAPEEVLAMRPEDFGDLNVVGMAGRARSRVNMWHNVLISMQKRTEDLLAQGEGRPSVEPFPPLLTRTDGMDAKRLRHFQAITKLVEELFSDQVFIQLFDGAVPTTIFSKQLQRIHAITASSPSCLQQIVMFASGSLTRRSHLLSF